MSKNLIHVGKAQFRFHHHFLLITKYREAQSWENAESSQAFDMSKNLTFSACPVTRSTLW